MKLSKSESRLLIIAVLLIGSTLVIKGGVIPLWNKYQDLNLELSQKSHEWEKSKLVLESVEKYRIRLEGVNNKLIKIEEKIFSAKNNDEFEVQILEIINNQLKSSGLKVNNKMLELNKRENGNLTKVAINLSLQGNLDQLISFLKQLNSDKLFFQLEQLQIKANKDGLAINLMIAHYLLN